MTVLRSSFTNLVFLIIMPFDRFLGSIMSLDFELFINMHFHFSYCGTNHNCTLKTMWRHRGFVSSLMLPTLVLLLLNGLEVIMLYLYESLYLCTKEL